MALPMHYRAIHVWHVRGDLPGDWRELQKSAWREGTPLDALFLDAQGNWITARDLAPDHEIHRALAQDREHCRAGIPTGGGGEIRG